MSSFAAPRWGWPSRSGWMSGRVGPVRKEGQIGRGTEEATQLSREASISTLHRASTPNNGWSAFGSLPATTGSLTRSYLLAFCSASTRGRGERRRAASATVSGSSAAPTPRTPPSAGQPHRRRGVVPPRRVASRAVVLGDTGRRGAQDRTGHRARPHALVPAGRLI
jgi:hypothetical protein